jgi:hypothetical protein
MSLAHYHNMLWNTSFHIFILLKVHPKHIWLWMPWHVMLMICNANACVTPECYRLLQFSVQFGLQTKHRTEHRTSRNPKLKPNPKTEKTKISVRFGSIRFSLRFLVHFSQSRGLRTGTEPVDARPANHYARRGASVSVGSRSNGQQFGCSRTLRGCLVGGVKG